MNLLFNLAKIQQELMAGKYKPDRGSSFEICERGKKRLITGDTVRDRVVKHALCDDALLPAVKPKLIYDNSASLKGRGVSFARKRLLTHLRKYYMHHGSNSGYILLMDYSKYYDNIRHDKLINLLHRYVKDEQVMGLVKEMLKKHQVDVSYMSEDEYARCMDTVFDSLAYEERVDKPKLDGSKTMAKHVDIGDQLSQIAGIAYPIPIDNYVKIVKGCKYYARYMDDSYVIHESKDYLESLLAGIKAQADELGITLNPRKTRIVKLSSYWRYLQVQYSLTDTGRVIQKINSKAMTRMRRKMKKLVRILGPKEYQDWYQSWFRSHYKIMSKQQRSNLDRLYKTLTEAENGKQDLHSNLVRREQAGKSDLKWEQLYLYNSCRSKPVRRQAQERGHH
ncbi:hypothetical protein BTI91_04300 [Lactobacillus delbrueckii subsp. bulgaricus]|nr:hypothetical protein [Lactobacillus delbrueckii subsp. bulgaricus]